MISNIVALAFVLREAAHRAHLATKSYAQHQALGSFYVDVIEAADSLAEAAQGRMGLLEIPYLKRSQAKDIVEELRGYLATIIATAGQTVFTVPASAVGSVFINGVYQIPNDSYTHTNDTTITFSEPVPVNAKVVIL